MSGKSQTIGDFAVSRPSQIRPICRENRRSSQKSGTRRENRNAPDFPDLYPTIPDDRGCLRFRVLIGRENLGRSGNSEIPDHLGFSRHIKTRLNCVLVLSSLKTLWHKFSRYILTVKLSEASLSFREIFNFGSFTFQSLNF